MGSDEAERILTKRGFVFRSAKGSHRFGKHPDGRTVTIPRCKGDLKPGTFKSIERQSKEALK
jgi:predicted RNA binding protein YcfA (HicA-like mRNA interferase family)